MDTTTKKKKHAAAFYRGRSFPSLFCSAAFCNFSVGQWGYSAMVRHIVRSHTKKSERPNHDLFERRLWCSPCGQSQYRLLLLCVTRCINTCGIHVLFFICLGDKYGMYFPQWVLCIIVFECTVAKPVLRKKLHKQ